MWASMGVQRREVLRDFLESCEEGFNFLICQCQLKKMEIERANYIAILFYDYIIWQHLLKVEYKEIDRNLAVLISHLSPSVPRSQDMFHGDFNLIYLLPEEQFNEHVEWEAVCFCLHLPVRSSDTSCQLTASSPRLLGTLHRLYASGIPVCQQTSQFCISPLQAIKVKSQPHFLGTLTWRRFVYQEMKFPSEFKN